MLKNALNSILFVAPFSLEMRAVQLQNGRISGSLSDIIAQQSTWNIARWRLTVLKMWLRDEVWQTVLRLESHNWNKLIQRRTKGRYTCENITERMPRDSLQAVGGIFSCSVLKNCSHGILPCELDVTQLLWIKNAAVHVGQLKMSNQSMLTWLSFGIWQVLLPARLEDNP